MSASASTSEPGTIGALKMRRTLPNRVAYALAASVIGLGLFASVTPTPTAAQMAEFATALFLGMVARFYLFRTLVFQRPVHLADLKQNPLQDFELSELQVEPLDPPVDVEPEVRDATAPSTSDPARPPAP